jgi:GntR family transcriptional regulator/MocR family aminotransferase
VGRARVIYVGTFCKITFPALRLGYLVLPASLAPVFAQRRALDMRNSEISTQVVMAEFIAGGHFQRHIRRMRIAARSRRDALLRDWPASIPGCAAMPRVDAGLHLCVRVDSLQREGELVAAAAAVGVEVTPLSGYWLEYGSPPADQRAGLVLGFAAVPEGQITEALRLLHEAWGL